VTQGTDAALLRQKYQPPRPLTDPETVQAAALVREFPALAPSLAAYLVVVHGADGARTVIRAASLKMVDEAKAAGQDRTDARRYPGAGNRHQRRAAPKKCRPEAGR
jgi:hypothetical protein